MLHPVEAVVEEDDDAREVAQSPHLRARRRSTSSEDDVDRSVAGGIPSVRWPNTQADPARTQPRRTQSTGRSRTRPTRRSSVPSEPPPWPRNGAWVVVSLSIMIFVWWARRSFRKSTPAVHQVAQEAGSDPRSYSAPDSAWTAYESNVYQDPSEYETEGIIYDPDDAYDAQSPALEPHPVASQAPPSTFGIVYEHSGDEDLLPPMKPPPSWEDALANLNPNSSSLDLEQLAHLKSTLPQDALALSMATQRVDQVLLSFLFHNREAWTTVAAAYSSTGGKLLLPLKKHVEIELDMPLGSLQTNATNVPTSFDQGWCLGQLLAVLPPLAQQPDDYAHEAIPLLTSPSVGPPKGNFTLPHVAVTDEPGCWAFSGPKGQLGVSLSEPINITSFSIEHRSRWVHPEAKDAPYEVRLWGLILLAEHQRKYERFRLQNSKLFPKGPPGYMYLGTGWYDLSRGVVQRFEVYDMIKAMGLQTPMQSVRFVFLANHGADTTCVYRVRVHGDPVPNVDSSWEQY